MKVILLKDVPRIGKKDEVKDVADGFAQNALLPKKLAKIATPEALKTLADHKQKVLQTQASIIQKMKEEIEMLTNHKIVIECASNAQGHLFSKFKIPQLQKVFAQKGIVFDSKYIVPFEFKDTGIKTIQIKSPQVRGEFTIELKGIV